MQSSWCEMSASNSDLEVLSRRKSRQKLRKQEKIRFDDFYSAFQGQSVVLTSASSALDSVIDDIEGLKTPYWRRTKKPWMFLWPWLAERCGLLIINTSAMLTSAWRPRPQPHHTQPVL